MASPVSGNDRTDRSQNIATAIAEVSERASVLVREEIELAKAEVTQKATRLAKGAVVGVAAGMFIVTALFFILIGCAWLLYFELPIGNQFTYFYGFFVMAGILIVLGIVAGVIAAKAVKAGSPPTPKMAMEEARKIRETVGSSGQATSSPSTAAPGAGAAGAGVPSAGSPAAGTPTVGRPATGTQGTSSPGASSPGAGGGQGGAS